MNTPEFWGGLIGDMICFAFFWFTVLVYAETRKNCKFLGQLFGAVLVVTGLGVYSHLCQAWPAQEKGRQQGREEVTGLPISSKVDGHVFTPLAFIITEHRILVYDKDEKVYALDGIRLEDGLKPETLTVGTNISYTVYTKNNQLYFGRLETPKPEKS